MRDIVVGIDAGGTSTRALAVDLDGNRLGWARGPGANLNSSADAEHALRAALGDVVGNGARIHALVVAAAGAGPSGTPRATAIATAATTGYSVDRLVVHSDVEAAFAAGSIDPDGSVLIAGTGAVAARIRGFRVEVRQDGHGYLLGDRGSALWIAAAGARAVLAELDGHGTPTALSAAVLSLVRSDAAIVAREDAASLSDVEAIEAAVYSHAPAWLGTLAPLVESAAAQGDSAAAVIIDEAIDRLVGTARRAYDDGPLVITGSVATGMGFLGKRLRAALRDTLGVDASIVHDASVGAAALALRSVPGIDVRIAEQLVTAR